MDDEVWCIGIHGMGGVGKTSLALHIYNRLVQDVGTFGYRTYWVTVSQENSIGKLQNDIAKNLGLNFSNEDDERKRAAKLSQALTRENCVLILDDVWNKIPRDKVGIPNKVNGRKTCKLILTTRSLDICRWIGCQAKFKVQPLSEEEAWQLFEETLGQQTDLSPEVRDIAMSVAAKCSGLPLAIITMGGSMREVNDIQEWRNVLKKLEELTMGQEYMANEVHPILEFSYSRLNDMKLKLCFLCCALHPEDQEIERDELIGYFIAEGLIDEGKPWQAKVDEGHSMLKTLERCYLLESCKNNVGRTYVKMRDLTMSMALKFTKAGHPRFMVKSGVRFKDDGRRCVKMHDLMRDMALKITKTGHPRFMVKAGVGLKDIPPEQEWTEDLDKVSLMGNGIEEIPFGRSPRCPRLSTLLLNRNCLRRIADSFFEHMYALHVLDLSENQFLEKLPNSISDLENLTVLVLQGCQHLTYVPPLGKLRALQELDLSYTRIKEVPEGLDRLVNLKNLNMEGTLQLERFPSGTLGKLSHLQRLTLFTLGPVEVQAEELERLRKLKEIILWLSDIDGFKQFVKCLQQPLFGGQLDKYFLAVREGEYDDMSYGDDCDFYKVLILSGPYNVNGGEGEVGILLPYDLQLLRIGGCSFARGSACLYDDVFPSLCGNTTLLKECELRFCDGIESIISSSTSSYSSTSLQSLEKLSLRDLPDFVSLFRSKFLGFTVIAPSCGTFSNLKNLSVSNCPKIKSLFTSILQLLFRNLEVIIVWVCAQIKEIIETVTEDGLETSFFRNHDDDFHDIPLITLPKLKEIELVDLPELKSIFEGIMVCESIEEITVHKCTKLRRLPFSLPLVNGQLSAPTTLKKLYIDRESWESLEWDHPNAKEALRPYLVSNWI
ncbi:probable disease resistance protein At4g27220 [Actinidia eriantha]|uniref:probable disease resistance protein At4g27220 n=1 Tax=Actinidia eriantha TaxID=165200 RepID=UPI00258A9D22|nr:probable disease resistance protein At4g27220 [Actinidia eriantha]